MIRMIDHCFVSVLESNKFGNLNKVCLIGKILDDTDIIVIACQ